MNALLSLLLLVSCAKAQDPAPSPLSIDGAASLVASAAKASKIGFAITLGGTREASYYLGFKPRFGGITFQRHVEFCLGATGKNFTGEYRLLAAPMANVRPLIVGLFAEPFPIPDIWVGPLVRAPSFGERWTWKGNTGGQVSVRVRGL